MSAKLLAQRPCQLPPILLAVLIQLAPAVQWFSQQMTQPGSVIAIVIKIGGISAALLGGAQSMSGASTWVSSTNPPAGKVGASYTYRLQIAGAFSALSWSSSALPSGLAISTSAGQFLVQGTPTTAGTNTVTLTAWENSNKTGAQTSDNATFAFTNAPVAGTAPSITTPPRSQRQLPGTNAPFTVVPAGTAPFAYQWRKDNSPVPGQTNSTITFSNLTSTSGGSIAVVVTNAFGSITSAPVSLLIAGTPTITNSIVGAALRFQFQGETGVTYRVERGPTVDFVNATAVTNVTPTVDGPITITNTPTLGTNSFFRLRLLSP